MEPRNHPAGNKTILLVEDEDVVRNVTREVLELHGYCVLEAIDADEGLQLYRENVDIIDLLLTDVVMPGRNGREFANQLLAMSPSLKVIFMSGYTDRTIVRDSFSDPNINYLQKPFTLDTLTEKVLQVLEQNSPQVPTCDPIPSLAP
jgi:DNA-binding NtrC family response regulator